MKDLIEQISAKSEAFLKDANSQLDKGNKAAGLRARRTSLELEPLLKQFRKASLKASGVLSQTLSHEAEDNLSEKNRQTQQVC